MITTTPTVIALLNDADTGQLPFDQTRGHSRPVRPSSERMVARPAALPRSGLLLPSSPFLGLPGSDTVPQTHPPSPNPTPEQTAAHTGHSESQADVGTLPSAGTRDILAGLSQFNA